MNNTKTVSRRAVLATGGVAALGAGALLSGCGSSNKADAGTAASRSVPAPATSGTSAEASGAADGAATTSAGTTASSGAAAGGTSVAKLSDIPVGGSFGATLDGAPILLAQPTAGTVVGFSAICTHQGCPVKAAGKNVELSLPRLQLRRRDRQRAARTGHRTAGKIGCQCLRRRGTRP